MSVTFEYQKATEHTVENLYTSPHTLDWANQPNPFRSYVGALVVRLPVPKTHFTIAWPQQANNPLPFHIESLSMFLYHSVAIAAWKEVQSTKTRWPLRVNPSSGNLHAEEIHLCILDTIGLENGIYHFNVESFNLEKRIHLDDELSSYVRFVSKTDAPLKILLTTIVWREAWKYRNRAFRYCLLDGGHTEASLRIAGAHLGWKSIANRTFADNIMSSLFGLPNDETPVSFVEFGTPKRDTHPDVQIKRPKTLGKPGILSEHIISYPLIKRVVHATAQASKTEGFTIKASLELQPRPSSFLNKSWTTLVRTRRSGIKFDGITGCTYEDLKWIISTALNQSWYWSNGKVQKEWVVIYVYAHLVEGLVPGIYLYDDNTRQCKAIFKGDVKKLAIKLSLFQSIAGHSAFALSMLSNYYDIYENFGEKALRLAYQSAGRVGQSLYLAAESIGLNATGIGAYFDQDVRQVLSLDDSWFVLYNFTIGRALRDSRLKYLPAYSFEPSNYTS